LAGYSIIPPGGYRLADKDDAESFTIIPPGGYRLADKDDAQSFTIIPPGGYRLADNDCARDATALGGRSVYWSRITGSSNGHRFTTVSP
jgi:hypothetical protein